jgi:hypothetical protein
MQRAAATAAAKTDQETGWESDERIEITSVARKPAFFPSGKSPRYDYLVPGFRKPFGFDYSQFLQLLEGKAARIFCEVHLA